MGTSNADIEAAILRYVGPRFRKIAFIVGSVMFEQEIDLPDYEIHEIVLRMIDRGELESQGDIKEMRYSEVRRP